MLHACIISMQHYKLVSKEVCQILSWLLEQLAILALVDNMGTVQQGACSSMAAAELQRQRVLSCLARGPSRLFARG